MRRLHLVRALREARRPRPVPVAIALAVAALGLLVRVQIGWAEVVEIVVVSWIKVSLLTEMLGGSGRTVRSSLGFATTRFLPVLIVGVILNALAFAISLGLLAAVVPLVGPHPSGDLLSVVYTALVSLVGLLVTFRFLLTSAVLVTRPQAGVAEGLRVSWGLSGRAPWTALALAAGLQLPAIAVAATGNAQLVTLASRALALLLPLVTVAVQASLFLALAHDDVARPASRRRALRTTPP